MSTSGTIEAVALARTISSIVVPVCRAALPQVFRTERDVYDLLLLPARRLVEFYKAEPALQQAVVADLDVVQNGIKTEKDLRIALTEIAKVRKAVGRADAIDDPTKTSFRRGFREDDPNREVQDVASVENFSGVWSRILRFLDSEKDGSPLFDPKEYQNLRSSVVKLLRVAADNPKVDARVLPLAGFSGPAANEVRALGTRAAQNVRETMDGRVTGAVMFVADSDTMELTEFTKQIALVTLIPLLLPVVPPLIAYAQTWFISPDVEQIGIDPLKPGTGAKGAKWSNWILDQELLDKARKSGAAQSRVWHTYIERLNETVATQVWRYLNGTLNDFLSNFRDLSDGKVTLGSTFAHKVAALLWIREHAREFRTQNDSVMPRDKIEPWSALQFMSNPSAYFGLLVAAAEAKRQGSTGTSASLLKQISKSFALSQHFDMNAQMYLREVIVTLQKMESDVVSPATKQLRSMLSL